MRLFSFLYLCIIASSPLRMKARAFGKLVRCALSYPPTIIIVIAAR